MFFYDNDKDYHREIHDYWNENIKKFRRGSICAGVVMLLLGVLTLIWPIQSVVVIAYILAAAMIVFGIVRIIAYTQLPSYLRIGIGLLNGILDLLLGIMLIFSGTGTMLYTISFFFAFELIAAGIEELTVGTRVRFFGFPGVGNFTVGGIINIVIGALLLFMPGVSILTLSMLVTVFLITKGVVLVADGVRAGKLKD